MTPSNSKRESAIRSALDSTPHHTEYFARYARCSLAEAVVVLQRLKREGVALSGRGYAGMTWSKR